MAHRHCRCSAFASQRNAFFEGSAREAVQKGEDGNVWWERCLLPHPGQFLPAPKRGESGELGWDADNAIWYGECPFVGTPYSDASGIHPRCKIRRRVGVAAVTVNAAGKITSGVASPLCYPLQTVIAGELVGCTLGIRFAAPERGNACVVDCQAIVKGLKRGRAWCCHADRPYADLWREMWRIIDDVGDAERMQCQEYHHARWVKAHVAVKDIGTLISKADKSGNDGADKTAKQAVNMHPCDEKASERYEKAVNVVRKYGQWIGTVGGLNQGGDTDSAKNHRRCATIRVPRRAAKESPRHEPEWDCISGAWRCRGCARTANDSDNLRGKCRGYGPEVFEGWDNEPDGQHTIWTMHGWAWCTRCGGFAKRVARLLSDQCRGNVTDATQNALKWLKQGKSPYAPHPPLGNGRPRRSFDVPDAILSDLPVKGDIDRAIDDVLPIEEPAL